MLGAIDSLWAALPLGLRVGYGFVFGALNGWFAGVVIERVPKGIGISGIGDSPRSQCVCGRLLPMRENLPIISYLLLRGRARCCAARIPPWYLAVEVGMGLWWALAWALPWLLAALAASASGFALLVSGGLVHQRRASRGNRPANHQS